MKLAPAAKSTRRIFTARHATIYGIKKFCPSNDKEGQLNRMYGSNIAVGKRKVQLVLIHHKNISTTCFG